MGIAWPSDLLKNSKFLDKTSQIAVRTMDKIQETKVNVSLFPADISKNDKISRWRQIDEYLHSCIFSIEVFSCKSLESRSRPSVPFPSQLPRIFKSKPLQRLVGTHTHTHTQTGYYMYNPPPTRSG